MTFRVAFTAVNQTHDSRRGALLVTSAAAPTSATAAPTSATALPPPASAAVGAGPCFASLGLRLRLGLRLLRWLVRLRLLRLLLLLLLLRFLLLRFLLLRLLRLLRL